MLRTVFVLSALITPASLFAQQAALVGAWKISYAGGVRMENGERTVLWATGTLTVDRQGDSLIANLVTDPGPEPPRGPIRLAAAASADSAVFESRSKATVNINGEESTVTSISLWSLRVVGDSLTGNLERRIDGPYPQQMEPQPVSGRRKLGG